jgi:hypothetical protein
LKPPWSSVDAAEAVVADAVRLARLRGIAAACSTSREQKVMPEIKTGTAGVKNSPGFRVFPVSVVLAAGPNLPCEIIFEIA